MSSGPVSSLTRRHELDYKSYWEGHYRAGGDSGAGSYGDHAQYKADILNRLVRDRGIKTVLEFGCGDGNHLAYYEFGEYLGLDVAASAVSKCTQKYSDDATEAFRTIKPDEGLDLGTFDLVISIEVLMHVIDEDAFLWTLDNIFSHASRYVAILTPLTNLIDKPAATTRSTGTSSPISIPISASSQ